MIIRMDPDPYSDQAPRTENTVHSVTVEAFSKGEKYEMLPMENVKQFLRDLDPATRIIAKALLALSAEPIQVSTQESDEAFDIMARREIDGLDTGLTRTEAR